MQRQHPDHREEPVSPTLRGYIARRKTPGSPQRASMRGPSPAADQVLSAFADVSRRIHDLARELKCLGHFDDDSDRPKAA